MEAQKRNSNIDPKNFLTRADKLKDLNVPKSTPSRVIVRASESGLGFKTNCYPTEFNLSGVTKEMFDATVKGANRVVEGVWKIKKREEQIEYNRYTRKFLYFAILLIIISFILLIIMIYGTQQQSLLWATVALLVTAMIITLTVVTINIFTYPKFIHFENTIKKKLKTFLDNENNNTYQKLNFRWRMEEDFYWLELIDFNVSPADQVERYTITGIGNLGGLKHDSSQVMGDDKLIHGGSIRLRSEN